MNVRRLIYLQYKVFETLTLRFSIAYYTIRTRIKFCANGIKHGHLTAMGLPVVRMSNGGSAEIGDGFVIRSQAAFTDTGGDQPSKIVVKKGARLSIGNNVGVSASSIICHHRINIGDNVCIGGGCVIFDTNFHPINSLERANPITCNNGKVGTVDIKSNVFLGTSCIITKGVTIGENSVVAAGSVVVKDIPANEIWGGNPAKFIKKI